MVMPTIVGFRVERELLSDAIKPFLGSGIPPLVFLADGIQACFKTFTARECTISQDSCFFCRWELPLMYMNACVCLCACIGHMPM